MTRLGIMQPYFFPYLGYYELMARTDRWVVFDVVQYRPKSWMNRNRVLRPDTGWQYVGVPVARTEGRTLIQDALVVDRPAATAKILGQLDHYRSRGAPHAAAVRELVRDVLLGSASDHLAEVNTRSLDLVCSYLGLTVRSETASRMDLDLPPIDHPGQWALEICAALGADGYLNPPGGRELFDADAFARRGIDLAFTDLPTFTYRCDPYDFVPHLSILDVLMWCPPDDVRRSLLAPGPVGASSSQPREQVRLHA